MRHVGFDESEGSPDRSISLKDADSGGRSILNQQELHSDGATEKAEKGEGSSSPMLHTLLTPEVVTETT